MADTPEVFRMTPAEATAALDTMAQPFRKPPAPASPSTPAEAAARLRQLTADPKWRDGYLNGSAAIRREFTTLTELVASGDGAPDLAIETVDAVTDPHALPKAGYAALIDGLREGGMDDTAEQYLRDLDSGARTDRPTAGDSVACQRALDRLCRDPDFGRKVLAGDMAANALRTKLGNVVALAADDGAAVSPDVVKWLAENGLA